MSDFISWNSQPLKQWAEVHAQGQFIELEGKLTHYIVKGEGEPIILLHGFFYDSNMWCENFDVLARDYRVYALDLWGCGFSTREPLDYGYELYANQLKLFMEHLGIDRANLIGQSMGAGTIIKFCTKHHDKVNKIILVDAAGLPNPSPLMVRFFNLPLIGEFFLGLNNNFMRRQGLIDFFIFDEKIVTDRYVEKVTNAHKIKGSIQTSLAIQRKQFFDKLSEEIEVLKNIPIVSMIVWGREDKAIPVSQGIKLNRILEGSRFEVIDNAGHVPNYECAAKFNEVTLKFLSDSDERVTERELVK